MTAEMKNLVGILKDKAEGHRQECQQENKDDR